MKTQPQKEEKQEIVIIDPEMDEIDLSAQDFDDNNRTLADKENTISDLLGASERRLLKGRRL